MCGGDGQAGVSGAWGAIKDSLSTRDGAIDTIFRGGLGNQKKLAQLAWKEGVGDLRADGVLKQKKEETDPAAERAKAEAEATTQANARIAFQRKAQRDNSLLTGGGVAAAGTGRSTLGV